MESDLGLHTGFLVAAAAALAFHALMPVSGVRADSHGSRPALELV